jgi:3-phosphoglycerate kinase
MIDYKRFKKDTFASKSDKAKIKFKMIGTWGKAETILKEKVKAMNVFCPCDHNTNHDSPNQNTSNSPKSLKIKKHMHMEDVKSDSTKATKKEIDEMIMPGPGFVVKRS